MTKKLWFVCTYLEAIEKLNGISGFNFIAMVLGDACGYIYFDYTCVGTVKYLLRLVIIFRHVRMCGCVCTCALYLPEK